MVKIVIEADCGNSPKMGFVKDFNVAFAEGNIPFLADSVSDDIVWDQVGDTIIEGKDGFVKALESMSTQKTAELILTTVMSHGKLAAANGQIMMENGKQYSFCDVYHFTSAKGSTIKSIQSYVIQLEA